MSCIDKNGHYGESNFLTFLSNCFSTMEVCFLQQFSVILTKIISPQLTLNVCPTMLLSLFLVILFLCLSLTASIGKNFYCSMFIPLLKNIIGTLTCGCNRGKHLAIQISFCEVHFPTTWDTNKSFLKISKVLNFPRILSFISNFFDWGNSELLELRLLETGFLSRFQLNP